MEDWVALRLNEPVGNIRGLWFLRIGPIQAFCLLFSLGLPSGCSGKRIILDAHPVLPISNLVLGLVWLNFLFIDLNHRTVLLDVFGINVFSIILLSYSVSSVCWSELRLHLWALAMSFDWQRLIGLL